MLTFWISINCGGSHETASLSKSSRNFSHDWLLFNLFNNFILRWYCTITEANKNQPLITINMVKRFFYLRHVEADTKVISMGQPYTDMSIPH